MKKLFKNKIFKLSVSLFIITATVSLVLAGVNMLTESRIAAHTAQKEIETVRSYYVYGTTFEKQKSDLRFTHDSFDYFVAKTETGETLGYATTVTANGYGGAIEMMVCFDVYGQVNGMGVISWSETSGVGTRVEGEGFYQQFIGKIAPFKPVSGATKNRNEISVLSGASVSSKAVTAAVNKAYARLAYLFIEE